MINRIRAAVNLTRVSPLARRIKRERLTFLSGSKLLFLEKRLNDVADIDGEYLEFGVALGGSAVLIANCAKLQDRRFKGFDVFGMIPRPDSEKDDESARDRYRIISEGRAIGHAGETYYGYRPNLLAEVSETLNDHGLPLSENVRLIEGLFENTWADANVQSVAFCHIDCDWYQPVRFALEVVGPIISVGGIIVIDDYYAWRSARLAADEFLARNSNYVVIDGPSLALCRTD